MHTSYQPLYRQDIKHWFQAYYRNKIRDK